MYNTVSICVSTFLREFVGQISRFVCLCCDPGRHFQECAGTRPESAPRSALECFWAPASVRPKECPRVCFWALFGAKKRQKALKKRSSSRCPKALKKHSVGHFPARAPEHSCKWPGSQCFCYSNCNMSVELRD